VSSIKSNHGQNVDITFKSINEAWRIGDNINWTLRTSAKTIQKRDIVCLLQGASKPTVIRLYKNSFAIIIIAVTPLKGSSSRELGFSEARKCFFPRHFLLVWDWEQLPEETQNQEESNHWKSFDEATRTWNVALILEDLEEYKEAERRIQEAIKVYERVLEGTQSISKIQRGLTPLLWAVGNGYDTVVNLLLEEHNIEPNLNDSLYNRTSLSWADSKDQDGQTPLSWAAYNGHKAIVKLLLATGQVNANSKNKCGRTPLLGAAYNGHEVVVKLLLATGQVKADSKDKWGKTPLSWAAYNGHETIIKLLLATGQVEADSKDKWGRTPLSRAAYNRHEAIIKLLYGYSS
jgi:hypothetical protein